MSGTGAAPRTGLIDLPPEVASRRARRRRAPARRAGIVQRVAAVGYVLLGLAVATALAWPIYATPRLALVALAAGIAGAGIPLLVAWRGWPPAVGAGLVAVAYVLLVVPLAIPSALASPLAALVGLRDGVTGVVLGWKQLLTLDLPLGEYQAVLVPFLVVALAGTALATALAISSGRRATGAVAVVLAMSVFGIAFGPTAGGAPLEVAGLVLGSALQVALGVVALGISLVWLVLRARLERRSALAQARVDAGIVVTARAPIVALARRRLLAAALLVVALAVGLVAAPALSGVTATSTLRTGTEPLLVVRAQSSPLSTYRSAFEGDAFTAPMFEVSGAGGGIDRIRLAVLDDYDGQSFTVATGADDSAGAGSGDTGRFTRLPGGDAPGGSRDVHITVEQGLTGIWMPLPAGVASAPQFTGPRAAALADGFYLDRDTGAGIQIAPAASGARGLEAGDGYTVQVPAERAPALGAPGASSLIDLQSHPQLAGWIKAQAQPRTAAGFRELVTRLRDRGYLTHALDEDPTSQAWIAALQGAGAYSFQAAYAGHSSAREEALFQQLLDQQNRAGAGASPDLLVAGIGDDEQFATAAALVARAVGYQSRVVVGMRMTALAGSGVAPCPGTCTGGELAAWIEVRAPGATGWTVVDAEPQHERLPTLVTTGQQLPKNATVPELPKASTVQPPTTQHDDGRGQKAAHDAVADWLGAILPILRIIGIVLGAILLVLLPAIVLAVAKRLRRGARRRAPVPEVAVVGAWAELVDTWADGGVEAGPGTRRDQAARLGSPAASRLAVLTDAAVFGEHPPTRQAADEAWRLVDEELGRRRGMLGRMRGIRATVVPTSFLRALGLRGRDRGRDREVRG
jgi:hypothetical protein